MSTNHSRGAPTFGSVKLPLLVLALIGMIAAILAGCGGAGTDTGNPPDDTAPTITTQPTSRSVEVGANTTFSVLADGDSLTYQWYKVTAGTGQPIGGATSSTYTVTTAEAADAGTYYVIVSNSAGNATSNQVTLTVTDSSGGDTGGVDVVVD